MLSQASPAWSLKPQNDLIECRRIEREPVRRRDGQVHEALLVVQAVRTLPQINDLKGVVQAGRNRRGRHGIGRGNQARHRRGDDVRADLAWIIDRDGQNVAVCE